MSFRFRKSFNVGPFRTTISKSGISNSFGVKGFRITKKANGNTMHTLSIPKTGISYISEKSNKNKTEKIIDTKINNHDDNKTEYKNNKSKILITEPPKPLNKFMIFIQYFFACIFLFPILCFLLFIFIEIPELLIVSILLIGIASLIIYNIKYQKQNYKKSLKTFNEMEKIKELELSKISITLLDIIPLPLDQLELYLDLVNYASEQENFNQSFKINDINSKRYGNEIDGTFLNELYEKGYLFRDRGNYSINEEKFMYYLKMTDEGINYFYKKNGQTLSSEIELKMKKQGFALAIQKKLNSNLTLQQLTEFSQKMKQYNIKGFDDKDLEDVDILALKIIFNSLK